MTTKEPVAYLAWRDGQPSWDEDCVCQDAVYPVDEDDDRTSMPVYTHPAHDDTALLRMALEWFDAMRVGAMSRNNAEQLADEVSAALRKRLDAT